MTDVTSGEVTALMAESRRKRAERERADQQSQLLLAARQILQSGNMFDLTIQRLASEAGVSRQTVYRYFPQTQDVFRALSDSVITQIYSNLPDIPVSDPSYVPAFVDVALSVFCADAEVVRVLVLTSAIGRASGGWVQVDPEGVLASALAALPSEHRPVSSDPKVAARVLITYFRGALYGWAAGFLTDVEFAQEVRKAGALTIG